MEIGKKGAFFTLTALVMVSILFLVAQTNFDISKQNNSFILRDRITTIDHFVHDLERDIERGTRIATQRGLLGIQQQVTSEGNFLENKNKAFSEIIINGTYNNSELASMEDSNLKSWFERINRQANKMSIHVNYTINNVSVKHINPWNIQVKLNFSLNVSEKNGFAYWVREKTMKTNLSIIGYEDPLYNVESKGRLTYPIRQTNVTTFVDGNNTSGLLEHFDNHYYKRSDSAPSFLMRLERNLSHSPNGIESIVDLTKMEYMGLSTKNKSVIDHIYFSEQDPETWVINNTYDWLRIDNQSGRLKDYQIEEELLI
ncbi:MAG: hypothetical protein ACOCZQ_03115 [Nanoarchaeota archaeon]